MSQQELTALAEEIWGVFSGGELDAVLAVMQPDVVWKPSPFFAAEEGVYRGHEAIRRWAEQTQAVYKSYELRPRGFEALDDRRVLVTATLVVEPRQGAGYATNAAWIATFRDGKLSSAEGFASRAAALEAAGRGGQARSE